MLQLTAINRMLTYIGEIRLAADTDLDTLAEGSDGQVALQALDDITEDTLKRPWWFNTFDMGLLPDADGWVAIPESWYRVSVPGENYIIYNHRLYDKADNTDEFDIGIEIEATIQVSIPFDDLPETVATYVNYAAASDLALRVLGVSDISEKLEQKAGQALIEVYKENVENNQDNLVDAWGITDPTTSN